MQPLNPLRRTMFSYLRAAWPRASRASYSTGLCQTCMARPRRFAAPKTESRSFTTSSRRFQDKKSKTVEQVKSRNRSGPFSLISGLLFLTTGAGLIMYFRYEKERMARIRIAEHSKGVGKPKVGGPFTLKDQNGRPFSSEDDMKGRYALIYFGFSHCPDICPEELDKMAIMIDGVEAAYPGAMNSIFVTCDPARDTPAVIKAYLEDFHDALIGLTGTWEEIRDMCKAYRVYFSTPEGVKPGMDYLVDHSIYFYLMDPDGDFVEAIGRSTTGEEGAKVIKAHIGDWKGPLKRNR